MSNVMYEQGNLRILVVDDEKAIRSFLKTSLSYYGYSIFEAATGKKHWKKRLMFILM